MIVISIAIDQPSWDRTVGRRIFSDMVFMGIIYKAGLGQIIQCPKNMVLKE